MIEGIRYDRGKVSKAIITDDGFLKAHAVVTRAGIFEYLNADGSVRYELRHPDDVFNSDSLETLKMRPITNGHPEQKLVNADNAKELAIGYTGETVEVNDKFIVASLRVTDAKSIKDIQSGKRQELSLGYKVDLIPERGTYDGQEYTHRQTNIRYNHLAIVDKARAGESAKIHLDGADAMEVQSNHNEYALNFDKEIEMTEIKLATVQLDGLEYKASPEIANAYKKASDKSAELQVKVDSLTADVDKLKAERDDVKQKLDDALKVDMADKIKEGVKARVSLIESVKAIMGEKANEFKFDSMSDKEIKIQVIKEKCPTVNVDSESDVYLDARFNILVEQKQDTSVESDEMKLQREKLNIKSDGKGGESANDARKAMIADLTKQGAK